MFYIEDKPKVWIMYFNESKYTNGSVVDIVLVSPYNDIISMVYKHRFEFTNNMIEYEVLILCLRVVIFLKIS